MIRYRTPLKLHRNTKFCSRDYLTLGGFSLFRSFNSKVPMLLVAMISILVLSIACGSEDPTPTTPPTAAPAATSTSAPAMAPVAYVPTTEDLGGGSPAGFARIFENAISTSTAEAASEYADAAMPLPDGETLKIGFIFVGSQQDLGYNQAAFEGSQFLVQQHPDVEILYAENIPETAQVKSVMEGMIQQGAKVIFATSFGYSDATKELAEQHPGIIFLPTRGTWRARQTTEHTSATSGSWELRHGPSCGAFHQDQRAWFRRCVSHPSDAAQRQCIPFGRPLCESGCQYNIRVAW